LIRLRGDFVNDLLTVCVEILRHEKAYIPPPKNAANRSLCFTLYKADGLAQVQMQCGTKANAGAA